MYVTINFKQSLLYWKDNVTNRNSKPIAKDDRIAV